MNGIVTMQPLVDSILVEHRDVHEAVSDISAFLTCPYHDMSGATCAQMLRSRVADLRQHLARHFGSEQIGGFLEEATARLPRLARSAISLEREQPELLRQIDEMLDLIPDAALTPSVRARVAADFNRLSWRLAVHEATESLLVEEGFNQDNELND